MSIHNKTGIVALAAAALVIAFAGFGCAPRAPDDDRTTPPNTQDTGDVGTTVWSEYRSEALGIALPHPEGWYVQESPEHRSASLYDAAPPADSDEPARVFVQKLSGSVEDFMRKLPTVREDERVRIGGVERRRLVVQADQDTVVEMYLWEVDGAIYRASALVDEPRLEQVVERMEVSP